MSNNLDKEIETKYYGWIYMILNKVNGKIYIGQSCDKKGYLKRWKQHIKELNGKYHHNKHLQNAWNKYEEENFEFILLHELVFDNKEYMKYKLNEIEKFYIYEWNLLNDEFGYNIASGGSNGWSCAGKSEEEIKEWKNNISKSLKGRIFNEEWRNNMSESHKDKPLSEETKNKISEALKGENHHMYGKHHSKEVRLKISNAHKGKYISDETKNKMSKAHSGKNHHNYGTSDSIYMIDKNTGEIIEKFNHTGEVREYIEKKLNKKIMTSDINKCANGIIPSAYGYIWRWADKEGNIVFLDSDYENIEKIIIKNINTNEQVGEPFDGVEELAKHLGKSISTIRNYLNGKTPSKHKYKYEHIKVKNDFVEKANKYLVEFKMRNNKKNN